MEQFLLILAGVVITSLFQYFSLRLTKSSDKKLQHKDQLKLLSGELEDLIRHCIANRAVLNSIELNLGMPSDMHFQKLKIMESSLLFSPETYQLIDSKYTRYIHRIKMEIRNINVEIDAVIVFKSKPNPDIEILQQYIDYLVIKMQSTIDQLPKRLNEETIIDAAVLDRINQCKSVVETEKRKIIYELNLGSSPTTHLRD